MCMLSTIKICFQQICHCCLVDHPVSPIKNFYDVEEKIITHEQNPRVRLEAFTAVTMKNVFCDVALCRSCVDRCFGGTYRLHLQGNKIRERSTRVGRWVQTEPPVENNQHCKNWTEWERECRPYEKSAEELGGVCWVCVEGQRQVAEYCPEISVCRSEVGKNPGLLSEQYPSSYGARWRGCIGFRSLVAL
jgi:hypothetical protein